MINKVLDNNSQVLYYLVKYFNINDKGEIKYAR